MVTAEQRARATVYRDAAAEHITVARELLDAQHLVLANYIAGLAAECILRAYRHMIDPGFDARHDVQRLSTLANFADVAAPSDVERLGRWLGEVVSLWSNDHRYLTVAALRKRWTRRKLYVGVKGDFVHQRTRELVTAATEIVTLGVARWKTSFNA